MEEKKDILEKYERLKEVIKEYGRVAVAFSGGVDSTLLLYAASEALVDDAVAVTADMVTVPGYEIDEAKRYCKENSIRHIVRSIDILATDGFAKNPKDRCYICKKQIFKELIDAAKEAGAMVMLEGSNTDDLNSYRPGLQALKEMKVESPLVLADLSKGDIRELSRRFGLPAADKPAAPCLATRIPYGEAITEHNLMMIEEAETFLKEQGLNNIRVRKHKDIARIEIAPAAFGELIKDDVRSSIIERLKELGFKYVTLDLEGFRSGSMD